MGISDERKIALLRAITDAKAFLAAATVKQEEARCLIQQAKLLDEWLDAELGELSPAEWPKFKAEREKKSIQ